MTAGAIVELEDGRVQTFGTHNIRFLSPPEEIAKTTFTVEPIQLSYTREEISCAIKNYVDHSLGMKDNLHFTNNIRNGILFRLDLEKESKKR